MKAWWKIMLIVVGIAALSLTELAVMFWLGGRDVKKFCDEVKQGTPVSEMADLAKKHDVRYSLPGLRENSGTYLTFVNTPRSFGRHTCMVRHNNSVVVESEYSFVD